SGNRLGILGASRLVIDAVPLALFHYAPQPDGGVAFDAGASRPGLLGEALTDYAWDFGDGTIGSGERSHTTSTAPGPSRSASRSPTPPGKATPCPSRSGRRAGCRSPRPRSG